MEGFINGEAYGTISGTRTRPEPTSIDVVHFKEAKHFTHTGAHSYFVALDRQLYQPIGLRMLRVNKRL